MEIPVISRITGFEAEINHRLQNPTLISSILAGIEEISQIYSFWTLGALVLAFLATFTRFNLVIFRFRKVRTVISQPSSSQPVQLSRQEDDDDDEEDDESSCSSSTYLSEDEEDEEYMGDEDFRVAGSGNYEEDQGHYFNWSDFATGRNVVKSWRPDGLGLSLGLGNSTGSLVSMWDNSNTSPSSFFGQIPAMTSMLSSPAVIMSAGLENSRNVALRVWDTRVGRHIPEILAEWQPCWKKVAAGIDSGAGPNNKYSVDVRDIRNVKSPVEGLTESDVLLNKNTRWVGGGSVIVDGDHREVSCFNKEELLPGNDNGFVVSRYLSYLFCP
ncbi:hypothetical protein BVC80_1211g44 [Macleaya cordata]|uniref:Uncharacterized protein n=1 Tax=Macleaya cordata TaxID=56857 RepID=A0A200Q3F4_MACCD|nr:hypothetical protein BVC80_1211g44 [Macleaya cordata]